MVQSDLNELNWTYMV